MVLHNGSNYDYHFIIKGLAKEFQGEFNCLGESTEKYKKVKRIDKNGEEITKTISYKLLFIDNARFMASSLSDLVDNRAEGIHKVKCKHGHDNKTCETCGIKYKVCECWLEYINAKKDLTLYKCL